jgi:hypothetical protein
MTTIKKSDVHKALVKMEEHLFGHNNEDNPTQPVALRLVWVFAAAYQEDYRPEESIILLESHKLLQSSGYYYTED